MATDGLDFFELWDNVGKRTHRPTDVSTPPATDPDQWTPYVEGVVRRFTESPDGTRNTALNAAAFRLGQAVGAGQLAQTHCQRLLEHAAHESGYVADDGILATRSTIDSGMTSGISDPLPIPAPTVGLDVPAVTVLEPAQEDSFWTARPALDQLRQYARARMCSPWAVLGCALVRVVTAVPPFIVLPPIVGSEASLNLFVALVGPSGTGKGAAEAAAADAIDVGHVEVAHVGSGEGIAHLFAHREKGEVIRDRDAVLFTVPEVDNLSALGQRQGATLMPQLRMAWSGERLGFAYVDKTKTLPIDRHTYRLGLLLGVQPGRAAPLLEDSDGGTPQRFLWMPTTDPDVPEQPPGAPDPIDWHMPPGQWIANVRGISSLAIPEQARQTIIEARRDRLRGDGGALDGHALLARLKVAAALALLDQRREVNDEDWTLSATVMAVSDHTRAGVTRYLAHKLTQSNKARGEAEGDRAVVVAEKLDGVQIARVCRVITRALRAGDGEWGTRRDISISVASRDRAALDDALGNLLDAGQIETQIEAGKALYRLTDRT